MQFKLALRNLYRQKLRNGMTLAAICFGVASILLAAGFVQDIFVQLGEKTIHSQTGHIQVMREGFLERGTRRPDQFLISDADTLGRQLESITEVAEVGARLGFAGLLNNGRRDLAIIGEGVEPDKEARLGTSVTITAGRALSDADIFGIMLGEGVARALDLEPGDTTVLVANTPEGALNTIDFEVVGIFQSFSKEFDARAVRIPIESARSLLQVEGANLLVVRLHRTQDTDAAHEAVSARLQDKGLSAHRWETLSDFYQKTVDLYERQFGVFQAIILLMVLVSVINSVNMSTFERLREFGTVRALGNRSKDIFRQILVENAVLGLVGAISGALVGIVIALSVSAIGIPMPPPPNSDVGYLAEIRLGLASVSTAMLIGSCATILAAILPARRAASIAIADALRH